MSFIAPGFELPGALHRAQQEFDVCLAGTLDGIASGLEGKTSGPSQELHKAFLTFRSN